MTGYRLLINNGVVSSTADVKLLAIMVIFTLARSSSLCFYRKLDKRFVAVKLSWCWTSKCKFSSICNNFLL